MAQIILKNVKKQFNDEVVVKNINLTIQDGSFTVLVGPSGCGKSTTLRMIAGLEKQSSGEIWIGNRCVNDVPPGKRGVAMVFQNYALYPTMTVRDNIEFGLKNKKVPKKEREALIEDISEIVGLEQYLNKKPSTLSGGQRQRVALARAMVKKPDVFILDEPLSNLDAKLRGQMRSELIQLHKRLGTTFIYVTHDQVEAMSMGDEIVILDKGVIQQADSPLNVYHDPNNKFTAEFIGTPAMNVVEFEKVKVFLPELHEAIGYVGFRPEQVILDSEAYGKGMMMPCKIITRETLGAETIYQVENEAGVFNVKTYLAPIEEASKSIIKVPYEHLYFFNEKGERMRGISIMNKSEDFVVGGV
ncbi:ABC transporter ATP-binding protein [Alkalihalobacillus sp. BA299]|uniref:ABC transporter ATP-binding protein n=1 Tax=Alkalihalobacillus sp. BA299 TaxID=2815938 RepID=UPI001ADB087D|nr:ABC transporter ATP-binding protein [Alkalihalobacillus sp. BA299]